MVDIESLYTDLSVVRIEIQKRWHDHKLKQDIESYIGEIPPCFNNMPKGVLFRNIITPDHEFKRFITLTKKIKLAPLAIEYTTDIFSTRNEDKICLMKLAIFEKRNTNNEALFRYKTIANMQQNDNKKFSEITLESGEYLTSFHNNLLAKHAPPDLERYDLSSWIEQNGHKARDYYKKFFAFFLCHAVLFECFLAKGAEAVFESEVIVPAFQYIENKFGIKPLIASLLPSTSDRYWWCYQSNILDNIIIK